MNNISTHPTQSESDKGPWSSIQNISLQQSIMHTILKKASELKLALYHKLTSAGLINLRRRRGSPWLWKLTSFLRCLKTAVSYTWQAQYALILFGHSIICNHAGETVTQKLTVTTNNMCPPCSLDDPGCSAENCFQLWDKNDISLWCSFPSWRSWVMPKRGKNDWQFFYHFTHLEISLFCCINTCQTCLCVQSLSCS